MVRELGEEFVDDGSIQFRELIGQLWSAWFLTLSVGFGTILGAFSDGVVMLIGGFFGFLGDFIATPFDMHADWWADAWQTATDQFPMVQIFDFAVAVLVVAATFGLAIWGGYAIVRRI